MKSVSNLAKILLLILCLHTDYASAQSSGFFRELKMVITPEAPVGSYGKPMNVRFTNVGDDPIYSLFGAPRATVSVTGEDGIFVPVCRIFFGGGSCVIPGRFHRRSSVIYRVQYPDFGGVDSVNAPYDVSFGLAVDLDRATIKLSTPTAPLVSGRTVALSAFVRARSLTGDVTFFDESANALPGCVKLPVQPVNGATDAGIAECRLTVPLVSITAARRYGARYTYPNTPENNAAGRVAETSEQALELLPRGPEDYTDLWWAGAAENGWGVAMTTHGQRLAAIVYTYDEKGESAWYLMGGGRWNDAFTEITGELFRPANYQSPSFFLYYIAAGTPVGTATIRFTGRTTATVIYTINGMSATKSIQRQIFGSETTAPALRVADMWWYGSAENGYGFTLSQQGTAIVPVEYTYRQMRFPTAGENQFVITPNGTWTGTSWQGESYTTRSSPWLGATYNPAQFVATKTGGMFAIDFEDLDSASVQVKFASGLTLWKQATRLPF